MFFYNPTKGKLSFEDTFREIINYIQEVPNQTYKLIIGTDSHLHQQDTCFVIALIIHRVGKGARFFYHKKVQKKIKTLRQRIFYEAFLSIEVTEMIKQKLAEVHMEDLDVEIHIDIGENGDTKELIREVVGMITGSGHRARFKPDSFGATKVADRYTK